MSLQRAISDTDCYNHQVRFTHTTSVSYHHGQHHILAAQNDIASCDIDIASAINYHRPKQRYHLFGASLYQHRILYLCITSSYTTCAMSSNTNLNVPIVMANKPIITLSAIH